jgi:hypothetical protein
MGLSTGGRRERLPALRRDLSARHAPGTAAGDRRPVADDVVDRGRATRPPRHRVDRPPRFALGTALIALAAPRLFRIGIDRAREKGYLDRSTAS